MSFCRVALLFAVGALLISEVGCKKSAVQGKAAFTMKGATDCIGALDRKEYDVVLKSLAEVKAAIASEDQKQEYDRLLRRVKDVLLDRQTTDDQASKTYQALRFLESGR